ncbi:hypothetical protein [Xenorhabdus szentirmaii]|uniref:hypothetical protein n=1 Tax=Xenorhabdus szentirmaii TaxID=290112 RepID=UPI0019B67491|nr:MULTISPECIES: hypothetical protein [unclassified Xenorhabdus]MBD2806436.1 hypothetical protein [Xenorhabdus sp. ZM]MBD2825658.1 hypothetical protein [Xenorhabdus sp. 5]
MKKLTLWERSSLQFAILDRLHDVFFDVKDEIDVTPEFIQNTLEQYMQIATGDNYYLSRSVRLGEGELQQCSNCADWDDYLSSLCGDDEGEENLSNQNAQQLADKPVEQNISSDSKPANKIIEGEKDGITYQVKPLSVYEKFELMSDILMAIKNNRDKADYRAILAEDLQSIFESIHSLSKKDLRITGISKDTGERILERFNNNIRCLSKSVNTRDQFKDYIRHAVENTAEELEKVVIKEFSKLNSFYQDECITSKVHRNGTYIDATFKFNNKTINYSLSGEMQIGNH